MIKKQISIQNKKSFGKCNQMSLECVLGKAMIICIWARTHTTNRNSYIYVHIRAFRSLYNFLMGKLEILQSLISGITDIRKQIRGYGPLVTVSQHHR